MPITTRTVFLDIRKRQAAERSRLEHRLFELTTAPQLTPEQLKERDDLTKQLKDPSVLVDPLFLAVQASDDDLKTVTHDQGVFPSMGKHAKLAAAIVGIMQRDNRSDPESAGFREALALARQEYLDRRDVYDKALVVLEDEGRANSADKEKEVDAKTWAQVSKALIDEGVPADHPNFALRARFSLAACNGATDGTNPSNIPIDLPDLDEVSDVGIVEANLDAMQAVYFVGTLEEVRLFEVMDKIVELFNQGVLPVGRGKGGDLIFRYWKRSNDRFTEVERRNLYARSFGWPGGEAVQTAVNREFNDLWLRFVSAVSSFNRQLTLAELLRSSTPGSVSQEQVRKAGRDLAANLSLYGYGMAYFAATELQSQVREIITILSNEEVRACYGARDMWQVIDQVATLELGGARNSVRYRTMAKSGAVVIRWLARNGARLAAVGNLQLLDEASLRAVRSNSHKPTTDPTDADLVDACEQWLAVTGTPDTRVEEYAQPSESPNLTSRPIPIPSFARDLLDAGGDLAGMSIN